MPKTKQRWSFSLGQLLTLIAYVALFFGLVALQGTTGFTLWLILMITWLLIRSDDRTHLRVLQLLVAYGLLSITTLPLKSEWWFGEIPVFALPQSPKTSIASEVRSLIVSHLLGPLGLSQGSASPDYTFARPYALAVVYLLPLAIWLPLIARETRLRTPHRHWVIAVVLVAMTDYVMTLKWAGGPGLSFY